MQDPVYDIQFDTYKIGVIREPKPKGRVKLSYLPYTGKWTTRLMQKKDKSARK